MSITRPVHWLATYCLLVMTASSQAATIDTALVGNVNNPPDANGRGSVAKYFRIATKEVTNTQYVEFLNAVAASDSYGLYRTEMSTELKGGILRSGSSGSYSYSVKSPGQSGAYDYAKKPVMYVSWYDSIRFTNWLHNGQGSGDTETGAYTLLGGTPIPSNGASITRNAGARWFLPSEDEWYKSAYHKNDGVTGNYWDYPTQSDTPPNNLLPTSDIGNSANHVNNSGGYTRGPTYPMTDVGEYPITVGPYGTKDQAGNVFEWTEMLFNVSDRVARGGSWNHFNSDMRFSSFRVFAASLESSTVGFRVATIPEPGTLLLGIIGGLVYLSRLGHNGNASY